MGYDSKNLIRKTLVVLKTLVVIFVFAGLSEEVSAKAKVKSSKKNRTMVIKPTPLAPQKRGPTQREILDIETKALKQLLTDDHIKTMKDAEGVTAQSIIQTKISSNEREAKILDLEDKILMSDYVLATYKDLNQWQDLQSKKDGITLIKEDRAKKVAQLQKLKAEQLQLLELGQR